MLMKLEVPDHIGAEKIQEAMRLLGDLYLLSVPDGTVIGFPISQLPARRLPQRHNNVVRMNQWRHRSSTRLTKPPEIA